MSWLQEPFFLVTNFFIVFVYCSLDSQANFEPMVTCLGTDFREDMEFHFSLGWHTILRKFLWPRYAGVAIAMGANVRTRL